MSPRRPILRYLGGKWRMAPDIIAYFPEHRIYLEPFGGAASVLLQKPRAYNELYNDLCGEVVNLFRVLASPAAADLARIVDLTPYARAEYEAAYEPAGDPVERARRMLIRSHFGHGTTNVRTHRQAGFRRDGKSGQTNVAGEWAEFAATILACSERLKGVTIENQPASALIADYDDPKVLMYLDPPYPGGTRSSKSKNGEGYHTYNFEMTTEDHAALLDQARASSAMIVISTYPNEQYERQLAGWTKRLIDARAHRNLPRIEALYINPPAWRALGHGPLFEAAE